MNSWLTPIYGDRQNLYFIAGLKKYMLSKDAAAQSFNCYFSDLDAHEF